MVSVQPEPKDDYDDEDDEAWADFDMGCGDDCPVCNDWSGVYGEEGAYL